ncbi:hypothetical protein BDV28DRAFT_127250 [Aspergillus coremiiformis]|uniref:Cytochrome b561 domain-containing protein n=1 Tax=Aspergillus coremiiformis TaxID=138285 RepID=A0A5N6ZFF3_9EURO|nr:hypothetical protein BDV28DRAFT_127250 [Aspergillus coremiiformis]
MTRDSISRVVRIWITVILCFLQITHAEPVQYCKFGYNGKHENAEVDFCMGVTMHKNQSSEAYDMYLSMTITRGSDLGWTAIGTGSRMAGSLMTIVYGDPLSKEPPIVSIRTATGHHQPKPISSEEAGGAEIRLLQAKWRTVDEEDALAAVSSSSPIHLAEVALVCYSCNLWPVTGKGGHPITPMATSLPWIWAWNEDQQISELTDDVHLNAHKHRAGNGGWGTFYVDMARSLNPADSIPSVPLIHTGVRTLGTSDTPLNGGATFTWFHHHTVAQIHGFLMGIAFLCLFPLGVLAMRSQSSKSFKYHWIIQLVASLCTGLGAILGILMSWGSFNSPHQVAGLLVSLTLGCQAFLGWRHHVIFLRVRHRTWISHAHIWTGRLIMVVGWVNFITGMLLVGISQGWTLLVAAIIVVEIVGLTFWVWACNRRNLRKAEESDMPWRSEGEGEYFAVGEDEEDTEMNEVGDNDKHESSPYDPMLRKHDSA